MPSENSAPTGLPTGLIEIARRGVGEKKVVVDEGHVRRRVGLVKFHYLSDRIFSAPGCEKIGAMFIRVVRRWILVLGCATAILASQLSTPQALREKAVSIPIGNQVEIRLLPNGKERVKGQMMSVSDTGVTVRTVDGGQIKERAVAFDQMQLLAHKKDSHTGLKILAGIGIAFASLAVVGLIIGAMGGI